MRPDIVIFTNDLMPQEYVPVEGDTKFLFFVIIMSLLLRAIVLMYSLILKDYLNLNSYLFRYICYSFENLAYKVKHRFYNIVEIPFSSKKLLHYLTKMQELSNDIGALFFTFVLYRPESMSRCVIPEDENIIVSTLLGYAAKSKIKCINLMGSMCDIPVQNLDIGDGTHYTSTGHRVIAEEIYKKISEFILISP